ncbi:shikimate kinase [Sutcliffiella rhizosphaerae]|uniref:Shikimate kinase n=1 Tax=Sutcliffiella rhizosphaerae TaxID=2880967 RepID=A0ABM8YHA4_9BACI|nr:shikimate kinase [Sutcliffiella rhizosphaerae]CAG9619265.1 Shikimate kinase [Sutcliffiella rhizosphaerae]
MKSIYLTGFMGAGKTTIGEELGKALQLPVYDTDQLIESNEKMTIKEIFAQQGEEYFRKLERKALKELPVQDAIITTGGGVVLSGENVDWMKQNGCMVFLYAEMDKVWERLEKDQTRPLIMQKSRDEVAAIFEMRLPLYREAQLIVDTTNLSVVESVKSVVDVVKSWEKGQH